MANYIDREALIESLCEDCELVGICTEQCIDMRMIQDFPAANVAPVRYGRWVISRTDYGWNGAEFPTHCKCDQCGREVPYQDRDNYCPNCGAKMEETE